MRVYYRTFHPQAIIREGFKDGEGTELWSGVRVSDVPLDDKEGAKGDALLTLEVPEAELTPYEWVEEGKLYREFLCPADLLNRYGPPRALSEMETEEAELAGREVLERRLDDDMAARPEAYDDLMRALIARARAARAGKPG
jgi:hypothetical protein